MAYPSRRSKEAAGASPIHGRMEVTKGTARHGGSEGLFVKCKYRPK